VCASVIMVRGDSAAGDCMVVEWSRGGGCFHLVVHIW